MEPENIELIEKTLSQLNIRSRKYPIKNGIIYFCDAKGYITFNLIINNDRTIKIWRYVQTSFFTYRLSKVDNIESKFKNYSIGIEVTDEGDTSFYTKYQLTRNDNETQKVLCKLIRAYLKALDYFCVRIT